MNRPNKIILHHSLTKDGLVNDWNAIRRYHMHTKGWRDVGYHWGIENVNGKYVIQKGRNENETGAHTLGQNSKSIGICIVGNYDLRRPDTRAIALLITLLKSIYSRHGVLPIETHHKYASYKSCPGTKFPVDYVRNAMRKKVIKEVKKEYSIFKDFETISNYAKPAVRNMEKFGIFVGTDDGDFKPTKPLTRQDVAVVLNRLIIYLDKKE